MLVSLPDDDEGERAAIARLTTEARDELATTLGVPAPAKITLRFHPTTDDYERATGQSWFTSGAWVGDELHLLPLAVLRERGVLERTIRHELVHAMADERARQAPGVGARRRGDLLCGGAADSGRDGPSRPAPGASRILPAGQRAAAAGVGRGAGRRVRAGTVVLCPSDCRRQELARRQVTESGNRVIG